MKLLGLIVRNSILIALMGLSTTSCNVIKIVENKQKENIAFNSGYNDFLYVDNQIIFETMFSDGKNRNMLLDLGAPGNIIFLDTTYSQLIKDQKPSYGLRKVKSADGIVKSQIYYHFGTLISSHFTIENSFVLSLQRPDLNSCMKINGLFGANNFAPDLKGKKNKIINIQMQDSTIAFLDTLPSLENWIPIEARFTKTSHIKIAITISGEKYWFYFDTGFMGSLGIKRETYKNLTAKPDRVPNERKAYGYFTNTLSDPQFDTVIARTINLSLSKSVMADSVPVISLKALNIDVVGMEFIRRYNVLVDYQNKKLYLQANPYYKDPEPSFFTIKGFKVVNTENQKIPIMNITMNSPAEKAGLKIGDQVIKINKFLFNQGNNCETLKQFKLIDGNRSDNEITVQRGDETLKFIL